MSHDLLVRYRPTYCDYGRWSSEVKLTLNSVKRSLTPTT